MKELSDSWNLNLTPLKDEKLVSVELSEDKENLIFHLESGKVLKYWTEGDCCSHSWIEHITVPSDIEGQEIIGWDEKDLDTFEQDYSTIQVYQTSFVTSVGEIIVEYRNASNGYYGGWLQGPSESQE